METETSDLSNTLINSKLHPYGEAETQAKSVNIRSMSVTNVKQDYLQTAPESKEVAPPTRQIPFTKYFTYLTTTDKVLLYAGTASAILAGAILPSISLVMGNVAVAFSGGSNG